MAKTKEFLWYPQRTEAEKETTRLATLMGSSIYQAGQTHQFQNRGFSERTIKALAKSVDAPERLLFMAEHDVRGGEPPLPVTDDRVVCCASHLPFSRMSRRT